MSPPSVPGSEGAPSNHGAHLKFVADTIVPRRIVRVPGVRVGIEVPTDLHVSGLVFLDDGSSLEVAAWVRLDAPGLRFRIVELTLRPGIDQHALYGDADSLDPETMRSIRWGQVFGGAVSELGRVVTVDDDGVETKHRGPLTLTENERVAALWLQARLAGLDANVHIAEQMGITPAAAAARVKRLRQTTPPMIPPATQGQRR